MTSWPQHWLRCRRRRSFEAAGFLNPTSFMAAVWQERRRSDRVGGVFSVIALAPAGNTAREIAPLAQLLAHRTRATDTRGELADGRLAVLLPDTTRAGARTLLRDLAALHSHTSWRAEILDYSTNDESNDQSQTGDTDPPGETTAVVDGTETPPEETPEETIESFLRVPLPAWKRMLDIGGSLGGLICLSPLLLLTAALIKLTSRGPIFFRQLRTGHGGRTFTIWKFRTMCVDAEARKAALVPLSERDGPAFKLKNDPRVTPLGRILRRSCIDELPQLWNVLRGDMSLVGPRPLPVAEADHCEPWQRERVAVAPGLTCTWQVSGGMIVSFRDWMKMDLHYVRSHQVLTDVRLLWRTLIAVIRHQASH